MEALRNVSNQSLILPKPGGGMVHLLPNRAMTLADEELQAPQVQNLVKSGLAVIEKIGPPTTPTPGERRRASEPPLPRRSGRTETTNPLRTDQ